jgi:hypothetical protein
MRVQLCTGGFVDERAAFFGEVITPAIKATEVVFSVWPEKK